VTITAIGIDIGSTTWKAVALDHTGSVAASIIEPATPLIEEQTERCLGELRSHSGARDNVPFAVTGYGRKRVQGARTVTEITCHARGAYHRIGSPGLLIDVGGQDTKVIRLGKGGTVVDFSMNDKCAAGTGRFLEVILQRLDVPLDDVAARVEAAERAVKVSSTCTVFAESEVVSLVAQGEPLDGIVKGLHASLASRVAALAGNPEKEVFMSGGVALNAAMVAALCDSLSRQVQIVPEPQLTGALGAALLAQAAAGT
jgi:predicted CoA-substrate-specific enzyme activase